MSSHLYNMLFQPVLPEFVYAVVSSFLDVYDENKEVVETLRRHAGNVVHYYHKGNLTFGNGSLFSICDSPTVVEFVDVGRLYYVAWTTEEGVIHREDGPAVVVYTGNNDISFQIWVRNGFIDNADEVHPAVVSTRNEYTHIWCQPMPLTLEHFDYHAGNDFERQIVPHRDEFAAKVIFYPSGKFMCEYWFQHGRSSRPNHQPAIILYHESGVIAQEAFVNWRGNETMRIHYDTEGNVIHINDMARLMETLRGRYIQGVEPINEFTADAVLEPLGLLGVVIEFEDDE